MTLAVPAAAAHPVDRTATLLGQPRGVAMLSAVELGERFGYYGVRAILLLYLVQERGWTDREALQFYGLFTGLAYLGPVAGGWIADRRLGAGRAVAVGAGLIALGYFAMALPSTRAFQAGILLAVAGTALFKPNIAALVGRGYTRDDPRRESGYTLFYLAINVGALTAPIVCGYLAERVTWGAGFAAAGAGATGALAVFLWCRRWCPDETSPEAAAEPTGPDVASDRERVAAIGLIFLVVLVFWAGFEQTGSTMTLFADRQVDRRVGDFLIPATWFPSINALAILALAPVFTALWPRIAQAGREPSTPDKMAMGLVLLGAGFAVLAAAGARGDAGALVSPWWLVAAYVLHTLGELLLSPVGLAYVSRVAPARMAGLMMALWYLAISAGNLLAGTAAALGEALPRGLYFALFVPAALAAALAVRLLAPRLAALTRGVAR